jgi:hypothetical protein
MEQDNLFQDEPPRGGLLEPLPVLQAAADHQQRHGGESSLPFSPYNPAGFVLFAAGILLLVAFFVLCIRSKRDGSFIGRGRRYDNTSNRKVAPLPVNYDDFGGQTIIEEEGEDQGD